jgi:hypothetical protein
MWDHVYASPEDALKDYRKYVQEAGSRGKYQHVHLSHGNVICWDNNEDCHFSIRIGSRTTNSIKRYFLKKHSAMLVHDCPSICFGAPTRSTWNGATGGVCYDYDYFVHSYLITLYLNIFSSQHLIMSEHHIYTVFHSVAHDAPCPLRKVPQSAPSI